MIDIFLDDSYIDHQEIGVVLIHHLYDLLEVPMSNFPTLNEADFDFDWTQKGLVCAGYRKLRGLSQDQVSKQIGMKRASIANFESGRQHLPIEKLAMLCRVLGFSCEMFMEEGTALNAFALVQLGGNMPISISANKNDLFEDAKSKGLGSNEQELLSNGYWISAIMWTIPDVSGVAA
jgi:transcriptional regulator with XRE-family HTH domain